MEQPIIADADIPETGSVVAEFFDRPVIVTRVNGRPRVVVATCPHFGGPLELHGTTLQCQWHQAEFGLDGACLRGPARSDSRAMVLPTRVIDGVVTYVYTPPADAPGAHEDDAVIASRLEVSTAEM